MRTERLIREHVQTVEIDYGDYRAWSSPLYEGAVGHFIALARSHGRSVSDVDCHVTCWCCEWNQYRITL